MESMNIPVYIYLKWPEGTKNLLALPETFILCIVNITKLWYYQECSLIFHQSQFIYLGARVKPTTCFSHSALRWSNTTALQQLPVGDHGGRMKTQMKGLTEGVRRVSARLKKWAALRPQTSARPSSLNNAEGEKHDAQMSLHVVLKATNNDKRARLTAFVV